LHLLTRFEENSNDVISEFINTIITRPKNISKKGFIESSIEKNRLDRETFGYNYWKTEIKETLINSDEFFKSIF
jgi:hypothetical protein